MTFKDDRSTVGVERAAVYHSHGAGGIRAKVACTRGSYAALLISAFTTDRAALAERPWLAAMGLARGGHAPGGSAAQDCGRGVAL